MAPRTVRAEGGRPGVVVVGAGVAGLAAAVALARRGVPVDVLERDRSSAPWGRRAAATWMRDGVPQVAHAHLFGPGCHRVLAAALPEVLSLLLSAGAREVPVGGPDPALAMRRPLFDWVLRRVAEREPGVRVHGGMPAAGLRVENGRVSGVVVPGGTLAAALVVDAAGARAAGAGWLPGRGRRTVEDGTAYFSRCYALRWSADAGELNLGAAAGGAFDGYTCRAVPGDNGTVTVTFGVPLASLGRSPRLRLPDVFQASAERVPHVADWVDPAAADPLTGVSVLEAWPPADPVGRRRAAGDHIVGRGGADSLPGLVRVGDARAAGDDIESDGGVQRALTDGLDVAARLLTGSEAGAGADAGTGAGAVAGAALSARHAWAATADAHLVRYRGSFGR